MLADERDLVRLRTNYRNEDVYLYRLAFNREVAGAVFLEYLRQINRLFGRPQWYNALLSNCTTNIRGHALAYTRDARIDWRMLVNGFVDEMAYRRSMLDARLPFAELKRLVSSTRRQGAGRSADFPCASATGFRCRESSLFTRGNDKARLLGPGFVTGGAGDAVRWRSG